MRTVFKKLKKINPAKTIGRENISVVIVLLVGFWLAWQTVLVVIKNNQLKLEIATLREQVSVLELQNQAIEFGIDYYKTDEFLERSAKENLLLKRPDENVAIAPLTRNAPFPAADNVDVSETPKKSNFQQWLDFALGR